jgi:hypothetical protein
MPKINRTYPKEQKEAILTKLSIDNIKLIGAIIMFIVNVLEQNIPLFLSVCMRNFISCILCSDF